MLAAGTAELLPPERSPVPGSGEGWRQAGSAAAVGSRLGADLPDVPGAGGLLAGLEPALRSAAARGLPLEVRVGGAGCPGISWRQDLEADAA
jgi:hypothetical protein